MDDFDKRFLDFLSDIAQKESKLDKMVKSVLTKYNDNYDEAEEIKQDVLVEVLKKKALLMKIFTTGNPAAYLWTMVLNTVRDRRRKTIVGDEQSFELMHHFRKQTFAMFRKSEELRSFRVGRTYSDLWYYTQATHENPQNLFITNDQKDFPDLDMERLKPGVQVLKKGEKIKEMAGFYLECWEKREQKPLAVKVNDFLAWIMGKVDLTDVYISKEEKTRKAWTLKDEDGEKIDNDMDRFEGGDHFQNLCEDRDTLFRKLDQMLDDREKRCLTMTLQGKTLEDIAGAEGYKGPSGAKALRDKAVVKIRLVMGSMGYEIGGANGETFESMKPFMDILSEYLNFSGPEPSN